MPKRKIDLASVKKNSKETKALKSKSKRHSEILAREVVEPEDSQEEGSLSSGEPDGDLEVPASEALRATFHSDSQADDKSDDRGPFLVDNSSRTSAVINALPVVYSGNLADVSISDKDGDDSGADKSDGEGDVDGHQADPFVNHFETVIPDDVAESAQQRRHITEKEYLLPRIGKFSVRRLRDEKLKMTELKNSFVRQSLLKSVSSLEPSWSKYSDEYFSLINNYVDLFHYHKDFSMDLDIKRAYCLHILNHALKTRNRIISHNSKIAEKADNSAEFRDQSYHRPKTLILLPFRHNAYRVYEIFCQLLHARDEMQIMNRKRFEDEFGWKNTDPIANDPNRPVDFKANFTGNTDDCFRIGISIAKKSLKLYTEFYAADIIIASPLGLRMIIGNEGDQKYEYDFLSSIELLILDQADVFLMQNWDHVLHIMKHMHRLPTNAKDVDFSRVRPWLLNGWGQVYRQTLLFASFRSPEFQAISNRYCRNYSGSAAAVFPEKDQVLTRVMASMTHTFHRMQGQDLQKTAEIRLRYFLEKVLQPFLSNDSSHVMVFIPSYFDFVCLRNHFKREEISFVQICEYSSSAKITRARDLFFHGKKKFLLYTERFHFYRRYRIRGIHHIVFYELPHYPQYYSEVCNMMITGDHAAGGMSSTVLFSKFDFFRLVPVVNLSKANEMIQDTKSQYTFVTGGSES